MIRGEEASTAVETVLAMSVLVPLLFSIVGFGDVLQRWIGLSAATAQAARFAGEVGGDTPEVRALLADALRGGGIDPERSRITISPARVGWREPITVEVVSPQRVPVPFLTSFDLSLRARFVGRGEVNR